MANKQIKDFDLKENVDGTEDILIQDNGVTKRIKASELLGAVSIVLLTQEEYDALEVKDEATLYIVKEWLYDWNK